MVISTACIPAWQPVVSIPYSRHTSRRNVAGYPAILSSTRKKRKAVHRSWASLSRKNSLVIGLVMSNGVVCQRGQVLPCKNHATRRERKGNERMSRLESRANIFSAISEETLNSFDFIPTDDKPRYTKRSSRDPVTSIHPSRTNPHAAPRLILQFSL